MLCNVYYFRSLIGSTESCSDCKQIELLRFLNKCYLLQLKYFFKVRFASEIKLILPKCAMMRTYDENIRKKCCFNNVVFIRRKRQALTKRDVNNSFFIAFVIWKLVSLLTYINYDWYAVVYQNIQNSNPLKNKVSKHMRTNELLKACVSAYSKI